MGAMEHQTTVLFEENENQLLFETSEDAAFILDQDRIAYINSAGVRLFGFKCREQLLGRLILDVVHPSQQDPLSKRIEHLKQKSQANVSHSREKYMRLDGAVVDVEITVGPFSYEGVSYTLVIAHDVAEQSFTRKTLHAYARRLAIQHKIDRAILASGTPQEIATAAIKDIFQVLPGTLASVFLFDFATEEFYILAQNQNGILNFPDVKRRPLQEFSGNMDVLRRGKIQVRKYVSGNQDFSDRCPAVIPTWDSALTVQLPLIASGNLIGVLKLRVQAQAWLAQHSYMEAAIEITDSLAVAIYNAHLIETQSRQLRRLNSLRTIDLAITREDDFAKTVQVVLAEVVAQLGMDAAALFRLNRQTQQLQCIGSTGFRSPRILTAVLRLGEGIAGRAALENRMVYFDHHSGTHENFVDSPLLAGEDFIAYYTVPLLVKDEVTGVLEVCKRSPLKPDKEWVGFLHALATQTAIAIDNAMLFQGLQQANQEITCAYDATIEGWSKALDLRDRETEGHTQRVAKIAVELAEAVGIPVEEQVNFMRGALLHDIGKMAIPDHILLKPGPLTEDEWFIMRQHPILAYNLLSSIPYLKPALEIPYGHHEKWDGSGYPRGLKGDEIPLAARIFCIIDVWDALRSDRPYRKAWPKEKVVSYIKSEAGKHFDPHIVDVFLHKFEPLE